MRSTPLLVLLVLLAHGPLLAQAPQAGTLHGRVVDEAQAPLAGATIELSRGGSVLRRTAADPAGRFLFVAVPPGAYDVSARLLGYREGTAKGVRVAGGASAPLTLVLAPAPVELESVEVTASRVKIQRETTEFATELREAELALLPVGHDPKDLVALTPGARAGQVWGGATAQANSYQLDGLAANHPGVGGDLVQPSISWIESIEVTGLGAGAEHGNFQGGLIDVTTKSGSNRLQGAFRSSLESHHLNASNLGEWDIGSEVATRYDVEGEVRGPLVRDRLFYFLAGHWIERDARHVNHVRQIEDPFLPALEERSEGKYFGKLTWRPTGRDRLDLVAGGIHPAVEHYGMSGYEAPGAALRLEAPTSFQSATWRHGFGARGHAEAKVARFARDESRAPYEGAETPGVQMYGLRPPYAAYQNSPLAFRHAPESVSAALALDLSARLLGAEHLLKVGVEHSAGSFVDERLRTGGMTWRPPQLPSFDPADPSTWTFSTLDFIPTTWGGEVRLHADVENSAAYLQDYIDFGPRLSVSPGVRLGRWRGWLKPGGDGGRRFLAVEDVAWEPRLGATLDLTGRNTLVAKAHWGRYHQSLMAQIFDRAAGGEVFTNEQLWYYRGGPFADPRTAFTEAERDRMAEEGRFTLEDQIVLNETGPVVDYRQPYVDQWLVGLEKALGERVKLEALYLSRRNRNMVALVDRNRATNYTVYEHVRVYDRGGSPLEIDGSELTLRRLHIPNRAILEYLRLLAAGGCDGCPRVPGMTLADTAHLSWDPDYALTNVPEARREFDQLQLSVQAAFPRWGGLASVVLSRLYGNLNSVTGYDDPAGYGAGPFVRVNEAVNSLGLLEDFAGRELKLAAWGDLPGRLRGGVYWNYRLGDHYSPVFTLSSLEYDYTTFGRWEEMGRLGRRLVTEPFPRALVDSLTGHNVFVGERGRKKYDPVATVDFRLEREFDVRGLGWVLTLDAFNVFNSETVTDYNTSVNRGKNYYALLPPSVGGTRGRDPSEFYRAVRGRVPPRTLRIGTLIRF